MGTRRQHYIPRTYIKAWESTVRNNKEPENDFIGVYIKDRTGIIELEQKKKFYG